MVRLLWAAGMLVWYFLFLRRCRGLLGTGEAAELALCAMTSGFVCGHLLYWAALGNWDQYSPFRGFWSAGALMGGAGGAALWTLVRRHARDWHRIAEAAFFAFPFCWLLVRIGCVLERAHSGRLSDSPFALNFPDGRRWDLALLEVLWAALISLVFVWLSRSGSRRGKFAALALISLGVARAACVPLQRTEPHLISFFMPAVLIAGGIVAWLGRDKPASGQASMATLA